MPPELLTSTELLIQASTLDGLVICELLHTHCNHRHVSMGIQMLGDDRCLDSSCGSALCLQEGYLWHDTLSWNGLHLGYSDPHQMRRGEWF